MAGEANFASYIDVLNESELSCMLKISPLATNPIAIMSGCVLGGKYKGAN